MKLKRAVTAVVSGTIGLLLVSLAGCALLAKNYGNKIIPEKNLIALKTGGPYEGTWSTEDVIFNYRYTRKDGQLTISGTIDFADSLKSFDKLDYFDFWIYFTNADNKIAGHLLISPKTFFDELEASTFEKTLTLSPDLKAMVFSYRGRASDSGSGGGDSIRDGGTSWIFWKTPLG